MTAIHQFLPRLAPRDAIGGHTLLIQEALRAQGIDSEIFVGDVDPTLRSRATHYEEFVGLPDRQPALLLYHASIGGAMGDALMHRHEPLIVDYHNITPPEHFEAWAPEVSVMLAGGRRELAALAGRASLGLADSGFNEGELREVGFSRTAVVPVLVDLEGLVGDVDVGMLERLSGFGGSCWLFVGRLAPNKAQHDLVKALAVYRRVWDPGARLVLVGAASSGAYEVALRRFVSELGLDGAVELVGSVSSGELGACYRAADVFVSVSEHEGFCVPLLEAMVYGVPVVAFGAAAVPETLGGAGLLLDVKSPAVVAAGVARVLGDVGLREGLVAAGRERLEDFSLERSRARLLDALAPLIETTT